MNNITIANFDGVSPFATAQTLVWEYDQTQYLQIEGLELPYSCSVDYCNVGDSSTITMPCVQGKAEIPNDFFETGKNIKAYVVLTDDASVQTRYEVVIPVIKRPIRTDIQPTPAEQQQIDALLQALSDGVDAADAAADEAEASAIAALASEQAAQASASEADQAASSAAEAVADVRAYAQEAEQAATAAAMSENNAEVSAQASAASSQSASDSATSAADSASAAADAVSDAAGYANEASQHATAAEQYANNASGYATDASDSAAEAAQKAADASASATAAAQSADNASAKASEASQSATNASASATAAETSATAAANAKTAAETAQGKAEDAQEAAETAQEAAEAAAQEAETALVNKADVITDTASGAIASFPDGADDAPMKDVVCEINPLQDLHGYDAPWPASGRGNLLPLTADTTISRNGITAVFAHGTITLSGTATAQTVIVVDLEEPIYLLPTNYKIALFNNAANSGVSFRTQDGDAGLHSFVLTAKNRVITAFVAQGEEHTTKVGVLVESGITANVTIKPMVVPQSVADPTVFYPYENLCTISGFTGLTLARTGKNLFGADTLYAENTLYSTSGLPSDNSTFNTYRVKAIANQSITLVGIPADTNFIYRVLLFNSAMGFVASLANNITGPAGVIKSTTITPPNDGWLIICARKSMTGGQIELGSTATAYEPYCGDTYNISWQTEAGTVYSGTLDVTTGVLTVDRVSVDMGNLNWMLRSSPIIFQCDIGVDYLKTVEQIAISSVYPFNGVVSSGAAANVEKKFSLYINGTYLWVKDSDYSSAKAFKSSLVGQNVVVYLANPQTYQLTPTEVTTLLGANNIWHDANGNTNVTYRADTKLYIQKINAPADDDMTADTQISSGKYFIIGNTLYLSTTTIPAGDTIIPGSNCIKTDLAAALNALNA